MKLGQNCSPSNRGNIYSASCVRSYIQRFLFKRISLTQNSRMIILLCMVSLALAEPPVGDSYLDADGQLSNDQISHQQYFSSDLTVPSAMTSKSLNALSNQYLPPNTRGISQEYGPSNTQARLSQEYGLPTPVTTAFRNGISQEYGTPVARFSQYGLLNSDLNRSFSSALKSGVSQRYGVPSSRNSLSGLYSSPFQRSFPSPQYGTTEFRSSNEYARHPSPVQKYGVTTFENTPTRARSNEFATPTTSIQTSIGHSNSFSSRLQNPQLQSSGNPFQSYGTPVRSFPSQHGRSAERNNLARLGPSVSSSISNTNAFASSYPSARSPFPEYGAPSSRASVPSQEYGVPEGSFGDQGYELSRNALDILNQKPANYEFGYQVNDGDSGSDFGHSESRQLDRAEGAYFVLLPDETNQVVEYEADEDGFKPRISVEPVDSETSLGPEGPY